jgi:GNAT superfamily N-acetyltransferase
MDRVDALVVPHPDWTLRAASSNDRDFLFDLNRETMRAYVDATWGWNDDEQVAYFDQHFDATRCRIIRAGSTDIGALAVEDRPDEIYLADIKLRPVWQGRGFGSAIVHWLLERGERPGKPVMLQVLHSNPRAVKLYASLGFAPYETTATHTRMRADPASHD